MDIESIKQQLAKPATRFFAGGFRPDDSDSESWLGRVFLYGTDEGIPCNDAGEQLLPYAQFHLADLPYCSPLLEGVEVLTLFIAYEFPEHFEPMGNNWLIREYRADDERVRKDLNTPNSFLKAFPLRAEAVAEDYPLWDGGGAPDELVSEIVKLERDGVIESYYDHVTHAYEHKIGGYPSFCQSGIDPGDGFEFVFQISSDSKINLNVVDSGSLMFWKHRVTGEWAIYYDFY
ncbi:DUF1963 domain-containing protein [Pseudomonas rubra]|uniref:DUF1963 domain-containing protein n=1 Tax=Pseudomonas rubra TaxID=2942627 RepID=A0ABT5P1M4_9PSED|nr:DUF1963 domain-containing protein [Pseudomonas rubra]MDD1012077.1 DUF1963 domain-containing protein [Pseudomonas rubra]MDD1038487.1 DUF1963 domain-containing protein [Pseudomonas rubra]MDD1153524.1 DUF1963 domain-containing protein [Pseudomonas rubra]